MNHTEKLILLFSLVVLVVYIIAFNLNVPHYWSGAERVVPENILKILQYATLFFAVSSLGVCIRDSGKRNLDDRSLWVLYMLIIGVIGMPHYYFRIGKAPRV